MKRIVLALALLALSTLAVAQTYSNANLNGTYSTQFGDPQVYTWSKTFICPTNSSFTYTVTSFAGGTSVGSGTATFDGNGNVSITLISSGNENQSASANTTSLTWNSSCQVGNINSGHVVYLAPNTKTQTGTYSIQSNGTGTMKVTGSSQSANLLLAATTNGISTTVFLSNPQVNGKSIGTGIAVRQ